MIYEAVLDTYPLLSDQVDRLELKIILRELEKVIEEHKDGAVVEFGCYVGTTSIFIQRLLTELGLSNEFHVYDSFEGLPNKDYQDLSATGEQFVAGELSASKSNFILNFKKYRLKLPHIHKGWFSELSDADIPQHIAFAFLDGDYYQSVLQPLKLIWPKLVPGAVVIIDDYQNEALPGVSKAVDEWIANRSVSHFRVQSSLAILRP